MKRDLPWRGRRDPYEILVSEVMLQQTQVEVVERYYETFLERFPTVQSLASADEDEVLACWSGLGYYRRAHNLKRAARSIVDRGGWPRTAGELAELPGIGEYTAAAVASIAFDDVALAIDGNVERVLSRRLALDLDPKRAAARRRLRAAGGELLDSRRPGDSNQALMELGATVCRPRSPRCLVCPLSKGCEAYALGSQEAFPAPRVKRQRVAVCWLLAVVVEDDRILLSRRPQSAGLTVGPWSLPSVELSAGESPSEKEVAQRLSREHGGTWKLAGRRATARHAVTYRDIELRIFEAKRARDEGDAGGRNDVRFFEIASLDDIPTTAVLVKALDAFERAEGDSDLP